jgi:hypothetical protein
MSVIICSPSQNQANYPCSRMKAPFVELCRHCTELPLRGPRKLRNLGSQLADDYFGAGSDSCAEKLPVDTFACWRRYPSRVRT